MYITLIAAIVFWLVLSPNFDLYGYSQVDNNPAFQESYWTDNSITTLDKSASSNSNGNVVKREVGPGEGAATLAVVLVNKARQDITAVKGYLDLPSGFRSILKGELTLNGSATGQVVASHNSIVPAGETFILHFDLEVLRNASVGPHSASLKLAYTKVLEAGQILSDKIDIPFRLTGKVIFDVTTAIKEFSPGSLNKAAIYIKKRRFCKRKWSNCFHKSRR